MTQSSTQSLIQTRLLKSTGSLSKQMAIVFGGVVFLALMAQVKIVLPFTVVPITGQTFGVTFLALCFGRKLGVATLATYLTAGAAGMPVFASYSTVFYGPTMGYLLGMFVSAYVVGGFADRGCTKSFQKSLIAGFSGSLCVYACGLIGLSYFVPSGNLFQMGMLPFIPGDFLKTTMAVFLATKIDKKWC